MSRAVASDDQGVEYAVEEGVARIVNVDWPAEGKRNAHVELAADGLRFAVKGWADTQNDELRRVLEDQPAQVRYRIETHRDKEVDPHLPIDEVDKLRKFRRLVVLESANGRGEGRSPSTRPEGGEAVPPPSSPPPRTDGPWKVRVVDVDAVEDLLNKAAGAGFEPMFVTSIYDAETDGERVLVATRKAS